MPIFAPLFLSALFFLGAAHADPLPKIFTAGMRGGYYGTDSVYEHSQGYLLDLKGQVVVGDPRRTNFTADIDAMAKIRNNQIDFSDADATFKARYLKEGRWGFELSALPIHYRFDDLFYELSAVEVSAVLKLAESREQQLTARAGVNPYTKRYYIDNYVDTDQAKFKAVERSARMPIAVEYRYGAGARSKFEIRAVAVYVLRVGRDSLDRSSGTIGSKELEGRNFYAHSAVGEGELNFRVSNYNGRATYLNGTVRAEYESHSQDFGVQVSRSSGRMLALGGLLVRF